MKSPWKLFLSLISATLLITGAANLRAEEGKQDESADSATENDTSDKEEAKNEQEVEGDKTLKVEPKKFEIRFESDGVFVAREMEEVRLEPEEWSEFKIEEIVPHGAEVHKGQVLVRFEDKKLKEAIEELELDQRLSELAIIKAEEDLPRQEQEIQMTFAQAERALEKAVEDYENYQETDRDMRIKSLEMQMKRAEQYAENVREELRQLEKMYEADDLTEETEEIILKRQRAAVEQAEFSLEQSKIEHQRSLESDLPRRDIQEKDTLEQAKLAFARAKTAFETDQNQVRYELEKSKRDRAKSLEKHAKLTSDLNLVTLKSPIDGVVYYGSNTQGKWSDTASQINKLKAGETAAADSTLITIVKPRPLYVVSSVKEADRPSVEPGQSATVQPTADDTLKLSAKVASASQIPVDDDKFALQLDLTTDDLPDWLVAGMTGKVKVTTYDKEDAIVVPTSAIHGDDGEKYVWIVTDGERERREVSTGKTKDDQTEITDGLVKGDVISLEDGADDANEDDEQADEASEENEDKDEE